MDVNARTTAPQTEKPIARRTDPAACISLVVPLLNEEEAVGPFLDAALGVADRNGLTVEVVFVDDGSTDRTAEVIAAAIARDPRIRLIRLSRNFGKEAALTAGIEHASGDAVVPMDVDLQDPPELLPAFVEKWREGYDVVYGRRISRGEDTFVKRKTAGAFYRLFNRIAHAPIPDNVGDFRLMDRIVVEALSRFQEKNRFMKGLFSAVGFRAIGVDYERPQRLHGQSKWNYWKLWNFALDGVMGFSTVPLRVWTYVGIVIAAFGFLYAGLIVIRAVAFGVDVPGYASLMTVVLVMGGVQLISLGVIGEYVGRLFIEAKNRPIYVVRETVNVDDQTPLGASLSQQMAR